MFEKEVNKNMKLMINSSRLVCSWYFQEEFDRQKREQRQWEEERRQREEKQRQREEEQRQWEFDRQWKEEKRQWKEEKRQLKDKIRRLNEEYMSDFRTEEENHPRFWKCNLIW